MGGVAARRRNRRLGRGARTRHRCGRPHRTQAGGCVAQPALTPEGSSPMAGITDKVVAVTGVAMGCGRVLAEAFAAEGAKVVGCDVDSDGGRATTEAVRAAGGDMTFVEADVSVDSSVRDFVDAAT